MDTWNASGTISLFGNTEVDYGRLVTVYLVSWLSIVTGLSKIRSLLFVCTESRLQRSRTDCEKCPELSLKLIVAESVSSYIGSRFTICRSRLSMGKCLSWGSCTILWLSVASVLFLNLSDFDYLWLYPDYSCLDADCIWVFWLSYTITRLAIPGHHCLLVLTPESVGNDWLWDDPECLELSWLSMIGYMSSYHWPRFSCIELANPELVTLACWDLDYLKLFLLSSCHWDESTCSYWYRRHATGLDCDYLVDV